MPNYHRPFKASGIYHVFNHANGSDNIFREKDNYRFFLEKYKKYIVPVANTYAYCLLKNHFHLMVQIKEVEYFRSIYTKTSVVSENVDLRNDGGFGGFRGFEDDDESLLDKFISKKVSKSFSNLFNSYTKAFNKTYKRMGSLFIPNVKRKKITDEAYFKHCVLYIHHNPVHHGFTDNIADWKYSSFYNITEGTNELVQVDDIYEWFGGKEQFTCAHQEIQELISVFD